MIGKFVLLFAILALAHSIEVVPEVDLEAYKGVWYEVASSPLVRYTIERGGYCTRAVYGLNSNGTISVLNQERKKSPQGQIQQIEGFAYQPDPSVPGKLKVNLGFPKEGDYWIVALGPIVDGQYEYAVVTEASRLMMWVLARDVQRYRDVHEATVKPLVVETFGFNHIWNKYLARVEEGCVPFDN